MSRLLFCGIIMRDMTDEKYDALDETATETIDDGSLEYLFKDYVDDGVREPIVDFGSAVGNEKW